MKSDREITQAVRTWLHDPDDVLPDRVIDDVLDRVPQTRQRRPLWRAWRRTFVSGTFRVALAGLVAVALVFAGFGLFRSNLGPGVVPSSTPAASTALPAAGEGLVAYPACTSSDSCRIWVADADGSNARELLPAVWGDQYPLAWTADGSGLLYRFSRIDYSGPEHLSGNLITGLGVTDAFGTATTEHRALCPLQTDAPSPYSCQAELEQVALAPDGTRAAYPISETSGEGGARTSTSSLALLDLRTGLVTRIATTRTTDPPMPCTTAASEGHAYGPAWSPDGRSIAFRRARIGPVPNGACQEGLFVVDVSSGEVTTLVLPGQLSGMYPDWSPDGSRLAFHGTSYGAQPFPEDFAHEVGIYSVGVDGSDLRMLRSDGISAWPAWTRDGRIVFVRWTSATSGRGDVFVMNADGSGATRLQPAIPDLSAVGCISCPYPMDLVQYWSDGHISEALWQPTGD